MKITAKTLATQKQPWTMDEIARKIRETEKAIQKKAKTATYSAMQDLINSLYDLKRIQRKLKHDNV